MLRGACWPLEARLPADLVAHVEFLCFASLRAELDAIPGSGPCAIPGSGPCGLRTDVEERAVRAADARIYALLCGAAVVTDALSGLPVVLGSLVLEPLHAVVLWRLVHARAFDAATPRTFRAWARVPFASELAIDDAARATFLRRIASSANASACYRSVVSAEVENELRLVPDD